MSGCIYVWPNVSKSRTLRTSDDCFSTPEAENNHCYWNPTKALISFWSRWHKRLDVQQLNLPSGKYYLNCNIFLTFQWHEQLFTEQILKLYNESRLAPTKERSKGVPWRRGLRQPMEICNGTLGCGATKKKNGVPYVLMKNPGCFLRGIFAMNLSKSPQNNWCSIIIAEKYPKQLGFFSSLLWRMGSYQLCLMSHAFLGEHDSKMSSCEEDGGHLTDMMEPKTQNVEWFHSKSHHLRNKV